MIIKFIVILAVFCYINCEKYKNLPKHKGSWNTKNIKITTDNPESVIDDIPQTHKEPVKRPEKTSNVKKVVLPSTLVKKEQKPQMIQPSIIQTWASEISENLFKTEKQVVRRETLLKNFADIKVEVRDGAAIVEKMAKDLETLLQRRARAATDIGNRAEALANDREDPPYYYRFENSNHLDEMKKDEKPESDLELPLNCSRLEKSLVETKTHFGADAAVDLNTSSVQVASEVFACDPGVLGDIYWSRGLLSTFKQNYAQDASIDFQYFCSAKGFLRHYPAATWSSMFTVLDPEEDEVDDVYDCRLRPWYVAAGGAPRDVLIMLDASGSMHNSSNLVNAEQFTLALLSALTDDDQVNVLRFNTVVDVESPITCFNDKLVPANHVNSAAMMAALKQFPLYNQTNMMQVLEHAVTMLHKQQSRRDRPPSCQQAIVLVTDIVEFNYTDLMRLLDPTGRIRLFVIWLHDPNGLRDNSLEYGGWASCNNDGYFAELVTDADVTEQVLRVLRVLERPLVAQRKERPIVFSDVYAHVEDPRRGEYFWMKKENAEQVYRYQQLRLNKKRLLNDLYKDWKRQLSLDENGHYYEGEDVKYRLLISVSVPVFESTTTENITIKLNEEKQRNSTRTYPVNRLLGVAGVDIHIDSIKLIIPYHQLGAGGTLFIIDHRGNIVLHNNTKPTFDGDILKPGYRTVDILDLEQPAIDLPPREYSLDWLEFRNALVIEQPKGTRTMFSKHIFEDGMRAMLEMREYHWRRVLEAYTAVVVLPKYNKRHSVPDGAFTKDLAAKAIEAFDSELAVHPDWLYCRHVDRLFDETEREVLHFMKRRRDEPNFQMQNHKHLFSPIKYVSLMEAPYQCNEELMARLCKEIVATGPWAKEQETYGSEPETFVLGSVTAFFASESGLTRWWQYHSIGEHAPAPSGNVWPGGPTEPWYLRAAAAPDTLVVHAPVAPFRKMRNTESKPPELGTRHKWLTAARTVGHPDKGLIGVGGYHFYPKHLEQLLKSTTFYPPADGQPGCDGVDWTCVLVDDGGWVVGGRPPNEDEDVEDEDRPIREHLSRLHPHAMSALLTANVFKLHWIHDYQAVCLPFQNEASAGSLLPSLIKSLWRSVYALFYVTREVIVILGILNSGAPAAGDTQIDIEKRHNRTIRDFEREKYDRLYDPRVLVNRTRFAACDRSRAFYVLQHSPGAAEALRRAARPCSWPLVGAPVPRTNLLLLAIFKHCSHDGRPLPDPLDNIQVDMNKAGTATLKSASRLACWRNRVPLPARRPHSACYPHSYSQEAGYRQCGPWLPDPEEGETAAENNANLIGFSKMLVFFVIVLSLNSSTVTEDL